jgi:hypothetical protein
LGLESPWMAALAHVGSGPMDTKPVDLNSMGWLAVDISEPPPSGGKEALLLAAETSRSVVVAGIRLHRHSKSL